MASDKIVQLTDDKFDSIIKETPLILVDFWADWCFPCKVIAPIIEEMAETYDGKLVCAKVNIDENPVTATKLSITGIPTVLIFKDGKLVERIVGAVPKEQLEGKIKAYL